MTLYAINIEGPDDMVPAPSLQEAQAACDLLNAAFARIPTFKDAPMRARIIEWQHGEIAHKADAHLFRDLLAAEL